MDVKEKIIDATERCLLEKGSHASSVKAIATMAGVNHGLIHHYFGSKEGLFIALLYKHYAQIRPPQDQTLFSEDEIIGYLQEFLVSNSKMMIEFRALSFQMPELNSALTSMARKMRTNIAKILTINEEDALVLLSAVSGLGFHASLDNSIDLRMYVEKIVKQFLNLH